MAFHVDDDGYMIAFTFGTTRAHTVELIGVNIEFTGLYRLSDGREIGFAGDRAAEIADLAIGYTRGPWAGLTSRKVRTATAHAGLLAEARRQLVEELGRYAFPDERIGRPVDPTRPHNDRTYAELAINYGEVISQHGRGARQVLADRYVVDDDTMRNWISEAKNRGMWATAGRGKQGQPTPRAFKVAQGEERQ